MKRESKSKYALLGLLSLRSGSGYDLSKLIDVSLKHFWHESYGQIYPTLKKLERAGLIESQKQAQDGKPDRIIYSLTVQGEDVFQIWLEEPAAMRPPRNELLLKLFFGAKAEPTIVRKQLLAFQSKQQEHLETYQEIEQWLELEHAGKADLPYWLATLSYGRHEAEAGIRWSQETLDTLALVDTEES